MAQAWPPTKQLAIFTVTLFSVNVVHFIMRRCADRKDASMAKQTKSFHHGDLKQALMDATLQLVGSVGPRGFTLNEASRQAGVAKSAPYKHFRDKDALLVEVALLGTRRMEQHLRSVSGLGGTPRERLLEVGLAYIAFSRQHPDFFAVMFQAGIDKNSYEELGVAATSVFSIADELAKEIEDSLVKARRLALAVWTMAHGFAMLLSEDAFARTKNVTLIETDARQMLAMVLR